MHDPHGHGYAPEARRKTTEPLVSFDGAVLLWITSILFVPAIFGVMFLPNPWRFIVMSSTVGIMLLYSLLYWMARANPDGGIAALLNMLHIGAKPRLPPGHI